MPEGELIGFNSFVENATRADKAADPSYNATTFTSFNVWGTVGGVAIYTGDVVTKGNDNIWKCAGNKQYWIDGASYEFAAVAGVDTQKVVPGTDKLPSTVTVDASTANVDLLYAEKVVRTGGEGDNTVDFNFKHLLSKVKFTVKNNSTTADGYSFMVDEIKVKGAKTGTITLANKTWLNMGDADVYDVADITVAVGDASEECASELLLIPGEFEVTYKVVIRCKGTDIATHTSTVNTVTLVGGNAYNLVIGVEVGDEITFTAEQTDWDYDINDDNKVDANDNIQLQ